MALDLETIYEQLFAYCEQQGFSGYDPFDGLNSSWFQRSPLKYSAAARLAWLQMVKRSPVDLRRVLGVKKGVNPKGLALFALAELSRFRATKEPQHAKNARKLIDRLYETKIEGRTKDGRRTTAFGYNFDWQSRVFYVPVGTPAIVPTAFASQAFVEAFSSFGEEKYLAAADEICGFILNDLNRPVETADEVCFSYTPVDQSVIYNASLFAGESLARVGAISGNTDYLEMAAKAARFVIRRQSENGSWQYGENASQKWVDNFHTAYVLLSLHRFSRAIPNLRSEISDVLLRGTDYWLDKFFLDDGTPKYYDSEIYPIDIHSAAVAIGTLCELKELDERMMPMAKKTAEWTVKNMRNERGFFYYQKRETRVLETPFIRWGQAWMAFALASLIESKDGK